MGEIKYHATEQKLTEQFSSSLALNNEYIREAVHLCYLSTALEQKTVWSKVVKCLINRNRTARRIFELMRLLELTEEWVQLNKLLTDREVFLIGWKIDRVKYLQTWKSVCSLCKSDFESVMGIALDPRNMWSVVEFLNDLDQVTVLFTINKLGEIDYAIRYLRKSFLSSLQKIS